MQSFGRALAYILVSLSLISFAFALLTYFDNAPGASAFGIFSGCVFGIPGSILLFNLLKRKKKGARHSLIQGFILSRDRFQIAGLAEALGTTPDEAERTLLQYMGHSAFEFLYHEATRSYVRRSAIQDDVQIKNHCDSCGAKLQQTMLLPGEIAHCRYCGGEI